MSPITVSRALNNPQLARPKTVEKVIQAVADYLLNKGYRRPGLLWTARRLSACRSYRTNPA
ncbi:LacI family transcriptional regulator [Citrobacter braakii]|nr:LacI family transcriptional regulator [Citrobacter braakii]